MKRNGLPFVASLLALVPILLSSCAAVQEAYSPTIFKPWSGATEFVGKGGTVRTVDGIDIWENGEPDRKFRLLGIIEQTTIRDSSVMSAFTQGNAEPRLVAEAKKHGADAITFVSQQSRFLGADVSVDAAGYYSGQNALQFNDRSSNMKKVAVVKYLDKGSAETKPAGSPSR